MAAIAKSTPSAVPGERGIAGRASDAQFVMVDDDLRPRLGPGRGRPEDQVDIDIADDSKRPHHSLRVILVVRTGVPTSSTRSQAKAIIRRCATGSIASVAARPVAGLKASVTAPGNRRLAGCVEDHDRCAGLDRGNGHRRDETGGRIVAAEEDDADARAQHLHRPVAQLATFQREAGAAGQFGKAQRQRLCDALKPTAGRDDGANLGQGCHSLGNVRLLRIFQSGKSGRRIVSQGGEDGEMQGKADRQAPGGGKRELSAAGADEAGRASCKKGARFQRQPEGFRRSPGLGEPTQHLGALARLGGHQDGGCHRPAAAGRVARRAAGRWHRCRARGRAARRPGRPHASRPCRAAAAGRSAGARRRSSPPMSRASSKEAMASARCRAISRSMATSPAGRALLYRHDHPLTPPLVSPEIRARCMTKPISTGGRAASTPAVAIRP